MKILVIANIDQHIQHFHMPYIQYLKETGNEVHVATNGKEKIAFSDKKYQIPFSRKIINVYEHVKAIKRLKNIMQKEKYDIIFCNTPISSALTRIAAKDTIKNNHTKIVYIVHGFFFYKNAPVYKWIVYYPIEKYLQKYTDYLITINYEDYDLAMKKLKKVKIKNIHGMGLDESKFQNKLTEEEKQKLRRDIGITKEDFVISIIGELNKNKNQIKAIKAIKELSRKYKNIKLILVGDGKLKKKYENRIKKYGIDDYVKILGYRRDVPQLLQISNCGVSVSKREGLPINVLEEIYIGIPTIVSNNRGNRDILKNSNSNIILLESNKTKKLKKAIEKLYNQNVNYSNKNNIDKFLLNNVMKEMIEIFKEIGIKDRKKVG